MSHGHDTKHAAHASGDKAGAYGNLASVEVEKLGNFSSGSVLEASKWASVNDPHPTGTLQSPALLAMSKVLGTACIEYNAAFFECKARTRNPEKCEKEGVAVTACAKNVYVPFQTPTDDAARSILAPAPHAAPIAVCNSCASVASAPTPPTPTASTRTTLSSAIAVTSKTLSTTVRPRSVCGACVGDVRGPALGGRDVATRICSREGGLIVMTSQLFFF